LLWNFKRGKETKKITPVELKMLKLKEELEKIKKGSERD